MDIRRELDEAFTRLIDQPWGREAPSAWQPAIDLHESAEAYYLVADLPGVEPEGIELSLSDRTITLCGSRSSMRHIETPRRVFAERSQGRFSRTFEVAEDIDSEAVTTSYRNGLYEVRLPKLKENRHE